MEVGSTFEVSRFSTLFWSLRTMALGPYGAICFESFSGGFLNDWRSNEAHPATSSRALDLSLFERTFKLVLNNLDSSRMILVLSQLTSMKFIRILEGETFSKIALDSMLTANYWL